MTIRLIFRPVDLIMLCLNILVIVLITLFAPDTFCGAGFTRL